MYWQSKHTLNTKQKGSSKTTKDCIGRLDLTRNATNDESSFACHIRDKKYPKIDWKDRIKIVENQPMDCIDGNNKQMPHPKKG